VFNLHIYIYMATNNNTTLIRILLNSPRYISSIMT